MVPSYTLSENVKDDVVIGAGVTVNPPTTVKLLLKFGLVCVTVVAARLYAPTETFPEEDVAAPFAPTYNPSPGDGTLGFSFFYSIHN